MIITDNLQKTADKIAIIFGWLDSIIKGKASPCGLCAGCEKKDDHKGIC